MGSYSHDATALRSRKAVALITLGCAKNEVDSERMRERMSEAGYRLTDDPARAHAVVVNTCSFIQAATEESLETIFEVAGLPAMEEGRAKLIVAGCMPARYGDDLASELTEACAFVPCSREDDIVAVLDEALFAQAGEGGEGADAVPEASELPGEPEAADADAQQTPRRVSAYVKISDGCDRFCAYCTIPFIRGRYRSFPYESILADVNAKVAQGVREIVLIAQDTGRWGADFEEPSSLARLMARLAEAFPAVWFRVLYIQPEGVTDELLDTIASHANICSYLDVPLQHVSEPVLRAMNRRGSRAAFERLLERVQERVPGITLRTTLIAGFPGETDEQFEELCDFVEESPFHYVGVFAYSREEGTKAAELPCQIDDDEKAERAQRLRDVADAVCTARIAERVGTRMDVLVEGCEEDGQLFGRAMCQAPDVDGVVYLSEGAVGDVVSVLVTDTLLYEMEGE